VQARPLVETVLGARWSGVAPIFAVLALATLFQPISGTMGWLFITQNRTRELRNWSLFSSTLIVASFVVGLRWGPVGVACGYVAMSAALTPPMWWYCTRVGPLSLRELLLGLAPYAVATIVSIGAEALLMQTIHSRGVALGVGALLAYPVFALALAPMRRGREAMSDAIAQVARYVGRLLPT